jgi:hypothetical protein
MKNADFIIIIRRGEPVCSPTMLVIPANAVIRFFKYLCVRCVFAVNISLRLCIFASLREIHIV